MNHKEKRIEAYKALEGKWFIHENGRGRYQVAKFLPTTFFIGAPPGFQIEGYRKNGTKRPGSFVERCDVFLDEYVPLAMVYPVEPKTIHAQRD